MAGVSSGTRKLLKCFCNCSELTIEEVKRIYRLSAQETLINREACLLFHKFLEKEQTGDSSEAKQLLEIYKKCDEYIINIHERIFTSDEVEELSALGLEYSHEKDLSKEVRTGDLYKIEMCLRRIQGKCRNRIECSDEYSKFKEAVLQKIRNAD
ncbi:uncharacterized protein LOC129616424 isoform X2 [Condylostylus longicornis]|uniref:uncharacterized protein LOC129616424 isoform X2 n=1 Tax=Condylostylus longicornis TaxID=2530218 RepID=UPI00244DD0BE|nr:uncharacterized protein LOC129616424 isoform X2 [Condylostylus longicornis]